MTQQTTELHIRLGVLCPPLIEQLEEQLLPYDKEEMIEIEKFRDAYNMLRFGILTDKEKQRIGQKIMNKITSCVKREMRKKSKKVNNQ